MMVCGLLAVALTGCTEANRTSQSDEEPYGRMDQSALPSAENRQPMQSSSETEQGQQTAEVTQPAVTQPSPQEAAQPPSETGEIGTMAETSPTQSPPSQDMAAAPETASAPLTETTVEPTQAETTSTSDPQATSTSVPTSQASMKETSGTIAWIDPEEEYLIIENIEQQTPSEEGAFPTSQTPEQTAEETVKVILDPATTVRDGMQQIQIQDLKVGDKVAVQSELRGAENVAVTITKGAAADVPPWS
jgi:hypothetical protein